MRMRLGLTGALALLAACGPNKPISDDDVGDGPEDTDTSDGNDGNDTSVPEAQCTLENYANDPQLLEFTEVGCLPLGPEGSCSVCDAACMESIVYDCPINGCGLPDFPCINSCGNHLTLCSEQLGDQCCYLVTASYNGGVPGRPLREHGCPRLPSLQLAGSCCGDSARDDAAAAYREFARFERASVDAFLHAAAILEQLGAPRELLERHRDAAREEAEHARLALAAAQALDGRVATLGEFGPMALDDDLEQFVCALIHDGCIGELVAAREADWARDLPSVRDCDELRDYWAPVATQEAGHAELAWRTLEWLLDARPSLRPTIVRALAAAIEVDVEVSGEPTSRAFGIASGSTQLALRRQVVAELTAEAGAVVAVA